MIRRTIAFIILIASVLVLRLAMGDNPTADLRATALAFGFALIAALLAGDIVERLRLPRLSGYLLFGLACGPFATDLISRVMASDLQQINGLAVALIAFVAGLEINLSQLRSILGQITKLALVLMAVPVLLFAAGFTLLWDMLPIAPVPSLTMQMAISFVIALLAVSFSPTVTIAVIAESRASGPLSRLVMTMVILADLLLIVVFALTLQFVRSISGVTGGEHGSLVAVLLWELIGSVAFGLAIGAAFALYLRFVGRELTIVLIGVCILLAGVGRLLHFEIVLASLAAGLVVENIAPPRGDALKIAVERGALPVLVVFFAAAGASLQLDAVAAVGLTALVVAIVRAGLLYVSTRIGVWWAGFEPPAQHTWMGLISQGGVTLGLATLVAAEFPEWGGPVYTLVIALTALHVLVGPIIFRAALSKSGEVGQLGEGEAVH